MFQTVLLALIISIGPTIAAIAALLAALKNRNQIDEVRNQIGEVHLMINSRLDQLLKSTGTASFAEGREAGRLGQVQSSAVSEARQKKAARATTATTLSARPASLTLDIVPAEGPVSGPAAAAAPKPKRVRKRKPPSAPAPAPDG